MITLRIQIQFTLDSFVLGESDVVFGGIRVHSSILTPCKYDDWDVGQVVDWG